MFGLFKRRSSAPVARERLQVLLAHERALLGRSDHLLGTLREEILAVIAKHISRSTRKRSVSKPPHGYGFHAQGGYRDPGRRGQNGRLTLKTG